MEKNPYINTFSGLLIITAKGILWAVLLSPLSVEKKYVVGEPHHITLQFGVERDKWEEYIGRQIDAYIEYEAWDDDIQALKVRIPSDIPCQNANPHISVSWRDGISPVRSNDMLLRPKFLVPIGMWMKLEIQFHEW